MIENKKHFRHVMLFHFRKGKNVSQTQKMCAVHGEDAIDDYTYHNYISGSDSFVKTILILAFWTIG